MNAIKLPNRNRIVRYSELENLISTDVYKRQPDDKRQMLGNVYDSVPA